MTTKAAKDINRILFEQRDLIPEAVEQWISDALRRHEMKGEPVVIYGDGKTVGVRVEKLGA